MQVLEFREVNKDFGRKRVLNRVSFRIETGKIIGLLGPNGSGKTTMMKIIAKLLRPSSGEVILGEGVGVKSLIEEPTFYKGLSGWENLRYLTAPERIGDKEIRSAAHLLKMDGYIKKRVGQYSMGMRQKLAIAYLVIGGAQLLVMDEPFNGLDPTTIAEARALLIDLAKTRNLAIFISSHLLKELQGMCSDIILIRQGEIVGQYSLNANDKVVLRFETEEDLRKAKETLGIGTESEDGLVIEEKENELPEIVFRLAEARIRLTEMKHIDEQIETIYRQVIGEFNAESGNKKNV